MTSEITKYEPPAIRYLDEWAVKLYESGVFTDVQSAAQAFVKIAAGAELGLSPFQSITGVHFIQNKPVVGAGLLASMLDRPPYNYTVEWTPDIENPQACTITVFKDGVERGKARFSLADAKRAGLNGGNWQKYPDDMLFARAISKAARRYAPGAMGTTFYVEAHGETEIQPNVTAEVITDAEVEFDPATEPPPAVVKPPGPLAEPLVAGPLPLNTQLRAMSLQDRADLYDLAGIAKGTALGKVRETLHAVAKSFAQLDGNDYDDKGEPDAPQILADARKLQMDSLPSDAADAFQHFADTGQDLSDDPQTALT